MQRLSRHFFVLLAGILACISSQYAWAAPVFTPERTVIFTSSMTAHSVVPTAAGYRMYLTSAGVQVLSATSTDQLSWTLEAGIRVSTGVSGVDQSSITALTVFKPTDTALPLRMLYVGVDNSGLYSLLSATSTDGLTWSKEAGTRLQFNGGNGGIDSPSVMTFGTNPLQLYLTADQNGADVRSDYRIFKATSSDSGLTFGSTSTVTSAEAHHVSVTTLTDSRVRVYYTAPLTGETTASQVLSIISSDSGSTFSSESDVRLSTTTPDFALVQPFVIQSTEPFRWRMFSSFRQSGSTATIVTRALTLTPTVDSFTPSTVLKTSNDTNFTLNGEIFDLSPTVSFTQGTSTFTATTSARQSDLQITGTFNPFGRSTGLYHVIVTNQDTNGGGLANGVLIDIPPGNVTILDNLLRPLQGDSATISIEIFEPGDVKVRLYTVNGALVTTLYDGPMPTGTTQVNWAATTSLGNTVASGVYLLAVEGPKIKTVKRIVVIK